MSADAFCAKAHPGDVAKQDIESDPTRASPNVFVYVKSGINGTYPPPATAAVIDQKGCRYTPHVFGVVAGQNIDILNSDPTLHNIHSLPEKNEAFNLGMPVQGMKYTKKFDKPEVMVQIKCDVHGWMSAYCGVVAAPVLRRDGRGRHVHDQEPPRGHVHDRGVAREVRHADAAGHGRRDGLQGGAVHVQGRCLRRFLRIGTRTVAVCVFLLLIAGALVTSTESGLAVPDWPLSYGKVMPPMVGGILYEHGHRLVAAAVSTLVGLELGACSFSSERRKTVKVLGAAAFARDPAAGASRRADGSLPPAARRVLRARGPRRDRLRPDGGRRAHVLEDLAHLIARARPASLPLEEISGFLQVRTARFRWVVARDGGGLRPDRPRRGHAPHGRGLADARLPDCLRLVASVSFGALAARAFPSTSRTASAPSSSSSSSSSRPARSPRCPGPSSRPLGAAWAGLVCLQAFLGALVDLVRAAPCP